MKETRQLKDKQDRKAKDILRRYVKGRCTDEERAWVEEWYHESGHSTAELDPDLAGKHLAEVWSALEHETAGRRVLSLRKIVSIAATLVAILGVSSWYAGRHAGGKTEPTVAHAQQPIQAGRDQALLTLADGRTIHLDSVAVGDHLAGDGISLMKTDNGTLSYSIAANSGDEATGKYNTISTPKGGQFKIILPDHSVVWINAASSLRFPVAFTGATRMVELEGEGYFEVEHDDTKPFIVVSGNQRTIVKGTKFNLTAYPDDPRQVTTLLEGSVLVKTGESQLRGDEVLLHPNEQAVLHNERITTSRIDALAAIAWKNGKFVYNNTPLEAIMKQLARWYDVEIVYREAVKEITFTGSISRFENIEDVLRKISLTESVRFEINERRIMVRH
ncbi:FecR family protein [Parapedobacter indicus]|uniref:FecR family protein n=1 Tax=Parapedobacter indicus TaxID=1477437 RepID=A0A1I3D4F2_9SPHI|nr:FecR family protein [Parapedobacter indicus]PPL04525.1 FecR family protein [Parapedobacter indicus]SFH81644.1 FecR family protein [Parapedobacter indicus]